MAKIRMLVSIAAADWSHYPGEELEVGKDIDPQTAVAWLNCGHAEAVKESKETATITPPEKAVSPGGDIDANLPATENPPGNRARNPGRPKASTKDS